jgi:hypothetical protein
MSRLSACALGVGCVFAPALAGAASEPTATASPSPAPAVAPAAPVAVSDSAAAPPSAPAGTPTKPVKDAGDLQSPEQVSTRYSAYMLPTNQWAITTGALGVGDGDVFALLSVGYGLGARVQLNINLAHAGVGLLNVSAGYQFIDTRYFDLGIRSGVWYGHGDWFWIATPASKKLLSKIDLVKVPIELTASSMPTRWLELDLGVQYNWAKVFGASSDDESLFTKSQVGLVQFFLRPGARFFISNNTALELFVKLPLYTAVPLENQSPTVPFKDTWWFEGGLRSRLAPGLYGNVRLNYAAISDVLYGARLYPAFEVEIRP